MDVMKRVEVHSLYKVQCCLSTRAIILFLCLIWKVKQSFPCIYLTKPWIKFNTRRSQLKHKKNLVWKCPGFPALERITFESLDVFTSSCNDNHNQVFSFSSEQVVPPPLLVVTRRSSFFIRTVYSMIAVVVDGVSCATPNDRIWQKPYHRTDI